MNLSRRAMLARASLLGVGASVLFARESQAIDYTYDANGRLIQVEYDDGSTVVYQYDAAGNRIQVVRSATPTTFRSAIQITGSSPVNLRTLANTAGYNGALNADVVFQLASNITISGAAGSPGNPGGIAIDTGTWPTGSYGVTLTLQISGKVYGGGGQGGAGNGGAGTAGGDAICCRLPMTLLLNAGGEIKAGGGGGGAGGRERVPQPPEVFFYGGGGGGGGAPNGPGGAGGNSVPGVGANGNGGTTSGGGAGGAGADGLGGNGGAGGGFGVAGTAGQSKNNPGGAGAAGGYAIRKNGHSVPVTNNGTITGTVG